MTNTLLKLRPHGLTPLMFALCGPSCVGKSTITKALVDSDQNLFFSVAATTRAPRLGEVEAGVYRFVSREEFEILRRQGRLAEHAERFGNLYGELREPLEAAISRGQDILFDTDEAGVAQISDRYPGCLATIGLVPPSIDELERRLWRRSNRSEDCAERLHNAHSAIAAACKCDYVIVNDSLAAAVDATRVIITAERARGVRNPKTQGVLAAPTLG